jgi:hypothetical protein
MCRKDYSTSELESMEIFMSRHLVCGGRHIRTANSRLALSLLQSLSHTWHTPYYHYTSVKKNGSSETYESLLCP